VKYLCLITGIEVLSNLGHYSAMIFAELRDSGKFVCCCICSVLIREDVYVSTFAIFGSYLHRCSRIYVYFNLCPAWRHFVPTLLSHIPSFSIGTRTTPYTRGKLSIPWVMVGVVIVNQVIIFVIVIIQIKGGIPFWGGSSGNFSFILLTRF